MFGRKCDIHSSLHEEFSQKYSLWNICLTNNVSIKLVYTSYGQMVIIPMFKHAFLWNCYQKHQTFVVNIFVLHKVLH